MPAGDAAPPQKKQKVENCAMVDGPGIRLSGLAKHQLRFEKNISPGALNSNRVAIQAPTSQSQEDGRYNIFFASGRDVYGVDVERAPSTALGQGLGKGGIHLPCAAADEACCRILPGCSLRSEVQSVQLSPPSPNGVSTLAATDCYGRTIAVHMCIDQNHGKSDESEENEDQQGEAGRGPGHGGGVSIRDVQVVQPIDIGVQAGWAGAAIAPDQPSQIAVARHFPKDITLFDGPIPVRTIHTMYRPYCIQLLSSTFSSGTAASGGPNPLVIAAEGPMVSVWDVRVAGRGARVARLCPNPHAGHFYTVACSDNGGGPAILGAAGADRSVVTWDPRKWTSMDRWFHCLKYEITSLHFLSSNPAYCLAGGLDYEVVCGRWAGDRRSRLGGGHRTAGTAGDMDGPALGGSVGAESDVQMDNVQAATISQQGISFRGDSRWMGLAKAHGRDVVVGMTSHKQMYVAEYVSG